MTTELPFCQASENNKRAILTILRSAFAPAKQVLEIGSGTGQHAVFFAENLPHLRWQASDRKDKLAGIEQWASTYSGQNLDPAIELDVMQSSWPSEFDAVFSANTAHIMPWDVTAHTVKQVANLLPENGVFALYGPFKYDGACTTESNANFDAFLRDDASHQGIRDFEALNEIAEAGGLSLVRDHNMPANNQLLVWKKL